jgi:TPR repeat protein
MERAISNYTTACGTLPEHCFNLALVLENGTGTKPDLPQARELYVRACDAGDLGSCNNGGLMLRNGKGGPRDAARAKELLKKACDGGVEVACGNLK